jgi:hypothetical protein
MVHCLTCLAVLFFHTPRPNGQAHFWLDTTPFLPMGIRVTPLARSVAVGMGLTIETTISAGSKVAVGISLVNR